MATSRSATLLLLLVAALASARARAAMPGKLILVKPGRLAKFIAKPVAGDTAAAVRSGSTRRPPATWASCSPSARRR